MSTVVSEHRATSEQERAIVLPADARSVIVAAAGTGKTHTLVRRLEKLLADDFSADEVLMLSFSRAAVKELAARTSSSTGRSRFVNARTFDAWALRLLNETYADEDWQRHSFDERIKAATDAIREGHADDHLAPFRHVLLDEIQDLVGARLAMVKALLEAVGCGFTLVGDPAQAVYGFQVRGSDTEPDVFSWVRTKYPHDLVQLSLTHDFRARTPRTAGLLECGSMLRRSPTPSGIDVAKLVRDEFAGTPSAGAVEDVVTGFEYFDGSCAILCRDNAQAMEVSSLLRRAAITHRLQGRTGDGARPVWLASLFRHGGLSVDRSVFADFSGLVGDSLTATWDSLLSVSRGGPDRIDLGRLRTALLKGSVPRFAFAQPPESVTVSSMHRAKGLEYDRVFVLSGRPRDDADGVEEARLLYMAMTRTRDDMFRVDPLPPTGATFAKRCSFSGRWGRYRFQRRHYRLGLALDEGDVSRNVPGGVAGFAADPLELQEYLATRVKQGYPVTLSRIDYYASDDEVGTPNYSVDHDGRPIGLVSDEFRRAVRGYMYGRRDVDSGASWPESITDCWVDAVEPVAGSVAAGSRAGLGQHGIWLAPRLAGLSWFRYGRRDGGDLA